MSAAPTPPELATRGRDPLGEAAFRDTTLRVIPERNAAHIPSFYTPHTDPAGTVVTQNGVPIPGARGKLQFTVADVAPERRWAIRESGEVLPQHDFESTLHRVRDEWFTRVEGVKPPGDLKNEVIPSVTRYVSMTPDPTDASRLIPIGFDPNAKPDPDAVKRLYDAKRDEFVEGDERLNQLIHAYRSPELRKFLKLDEVEEVEAALKARGGHIGGGGDLVAKLEQLNQLLADGDISEAVHSKRVAALTGASPVKAEPEPECAPEPDPNADPEPQVAKPGYMFAPCGAEIPKNQSKKHREACPECAE